MKAVYLHHSGILVETKGYQLFFDVISDVGDYVDKDKRIIFFITHSHYDHFDRRVYDYLELGAKYVISDDVSDLPKEGYTLVEAYKGLNYEGLEIQTYGSTDKGVSFMVGLEGYRVFHAGDLNWWHWGNDSEEAQKAEEKQYKEILKSIQAGPIDIAFIPCDPRLKSAMGWAIEYFVERMSPDLAVPIHFGDNFSVVKQWVKESEYSGKIVGPDRRGWNIEVTPHA